MPETLIECPQNCGRKFKSIDECEGHVKRRHPEVAQK